MKIPTVSNFLFDYKTHIEKREKVKTERGGEGARGRERERERRGRERERSRESKDVHQFRII